MLDFARADAERQRAEGAVRGRVAVAADDRHARLRQPQFRPDDVDDALVAVVEIVKADAEILAILPQSIDLLPGDFVGNRQRSAGGRHVMIDGRHRSLRPPDLSPRKPQALEGLRAGYLVDELQVDVQDRLFAAFRMDNVIVPDFLEHRAGECGHGGCAQFSGMF